MHCRARAGELQRGPEEYRDSGVGEDKVSPETTCPEWTLSLRCPSSGSRRQEARRWESWEGRLVGTKEPSLGTRNIFWRTTGECCSVGCVKGAATVPLPKLKRRTPCRQALGEGATPAQRDSHQLASITRAQALNGNVWEGNTTPPIQILPIF